MKKLFRSLLYIVLVAAMLATTTLQSFAAGLNEYVSEIKMAICDSLEDAKEELFGYTVVESDLNAEQGNGAQSVYLGYKTTTDKSKAITDLRLMDMNGGYSYNDYDKALEKMAEDITKEINGFYDAIKEFRQNKNDGKYNAEYAYKKMNMFKDDDQNDKLLGDIFMDENVTAEKLQTIFLQGNSSYILSLEELLAVACADNWMERLEENVKKVYGADAYVLEEYCEIVRNQWEYFRLGLEGYEDQMDSDDGLNMYDATPEEYDAWLESEPSDDDKYYVYNFAFAYHVLESYDYKGGTLLDYFMVPVEDVDYEYLYPIADAMTKGQLQTLQYIHLNKAVGYAEVDLNKFSNLVENYQDNIEESALSAINDKITDEDKKLELADSDAVSIYTGVDRTLFIQGDGVALTNDAIRKASNSDDQSAIAQVLNNAKWPLVIEASICAVTLTVAGIFYSSAKSAYAMAEGANIITAVEKYGYMVEKVSSESCVVNLMTELPDGLTSVEQLQIMNEASTSMAANAAIMGVAIGVTLIVMGISIYKGYVKYMNPEYKSVPRAIVDENTETVYNSYGVEVGTKSFYYAYYPVEDANPDGTHGNYADMNGWKAQQWNVMYYTRDSRAGQPILADTFVVQYGNSERPDGYTAFCEFGVSAAADLNKHAFSEVQGIYLFYKTAKASSTPTGIASVFANGYYAITAICGLVVGAGATLGLGAVLNKKRRKSVSAEA